MFKVTSPQPHALRCPSGSVHSDLALRLGHDLASQAPGLGQGGKEIVADDLIRLRPVHWEALMAMTQPPK